MRISTPSGHDLYEYWSLKSKQYGMPHRSHIEPVDLKSALKDVFILEFKTRDVFEFRISGTRLNAILNTELKNTNMLDLICASERKKIQIALASVSEKGLMATFTMIVTTQSGNIVELEALALPVKTYNENKFRIIGILSPTEISPWLGIDAPKQKNIKNVIIWNNPFLYTDKNVQSDPAFDIQNQDNLFHQDAKFPEQDIPDLSRMPSVSLPNRNKVLRRKRHLVLIEGGRTSGNKPLH